MEKQKPNDWKLGDGRIITLLTVTELRALEGDTEIISIMGDSRKALDNELGPPDEDTRFGYSAWGVLAEYEDAKQSNNTKGE